MARKSMIGTVVAALVISAFLLTWLEDTAPKVAVEQTGYYKSDARDRVMAFYSERELTEAAVRQVVDDQTKTGGALFRAVFYSGENIPLRDGLTLAPSLQKAMRLTAEHDEFDWIVMISPAGELTVKRQQ